MSFSRKFSNAVIAHVNKLDDPKLEPIILGLAGEIVTMKKYDKEGVRQTGQSLREVDRERAQAVISEIIQSLDPHP